MYEKYVGEKIHGEYYKPKHKTYLERVKGEYSDVVAFVIYDGEISDICAENNTGWSYDAIPELESVTEKGKRYWWFGSRYIENLVSYPCPMER